MTSTTKDTTVNLMTAAAAPTDTSVSTDKITAATTASSTNDSTKAVGPSVDDDLSLDAGEEALLKGGIPEIPEYTPPLRINHGAVQRLSSSSTSALSIPPNVQNQLRTTFRRKSEPAGGGIRSGSRSPISTSRHNSISNYDGGSSISSLDDIIDPDILTDKMGFLELDLKQQQESAQTLNASFSNLPPVTERMSDETLEDVHAFSDVRSGHGGSLSRGNSITTGGEVSSNVLEPLEECEEDDEIEGDRILFTNMGEILEADEEEHHESPSFVTS